MWVRRHSVRSLLRGIGAALVPAGLWVLGLMRLVAEWLRQAVQWVRETHMDTTRWIGVGGAAVGVIIWLIAGYLEPVTRKQAKQWRLERRRSQPAAPVAGAKQQVPAAPRASAPAPPKPAPRPASSKPAAGKPSGNPDKAGFTDEDRELMELLKERGID